MIKERENVINNFIAFLDVLVGVSSFGFALLIFFRESVFVNSRDFQIIVILIAITWWVLSKSFSLSILHRSRPMSGILFNCLRLSVLGTIVLGLLIYFLDLRDISIHIIKFFLPINLILTFTFKTIVYVYMRRARERGRNTRTILVIGDDSALVFIRQLQVQKQWGYRIVGVIGSESLKIQIGDSVPFLDSSTDISKILEDKVIDEVAYCKNEPIIKEVEDLVFICSEVGVVFRMYSPFFNMLANRTHLHYFDTLPMLTISKAPGDYFAQSIKVAFDFLTSLLILFILLPVFVIIGAIIKLTSSGSVFFKQERVGLMGRKFYIYKFRTMVQNAEALKEGLLHQNESDGPTFKMDRDPRITKVGKFLRKTSLDELPQFINVLLGDMSIVGPRPPVPSEVKEYERWQLRRLSMKPGITCIWQVSGRNTVSFDRWMEMDLEYIDNWSLKMDFIIFIKTIRAVLIASGR